MLIALLVLACTRPGDPPSADPALTETGSDTGAPCHQARTLGTPTHARPPQLGPPTWEAFGSHQVYSSPRLADLNGDGILDVISGRGATDIGQPLDTIGYATAHDGATGAELWRIDVRQEVFTTAALPELTGDGIPDPVFGARHAEFFAIDGASGALLWAFALDVEAARDAGWYNTFSAQPIDDRDGDGVTDLVIANGGDSLISPDDPDRPPGRLALVSGATGAVIASAWVPDGRETYLSPVLIGTDVIFGTGGETVAGQLWRTSLEDIAAGNIDDATPLLAGDLGAIAPPSVADLNGDCVDDIVTAHFSGTLAAIDGETHAVLWRLDHPGQTYNSPTLGYFNDDPVPDVFGSVMEGTWPDYERMVHFVIDGRSGDVLWTGELGVFGASGALAVDLDGDGLDEILLGVNDSGFTDPGPMGWMLYHLDPRDFSLTPMAATADRAGITSPWLGDLDGDGLLEMITSISHLGGENSEWRTARYDLDLPAPPTVSWGGYLGTHGDGHLSR